MDERDREAAARIFHEFDQINFGFIIFIVVLSVVLTLGIQRLLPRLAERMPGRFRFAILPLVPVLRLVILLLTVFTLIPQIVRPTVQNFVAIFGALGLALGFAFKDYVNRKTWAYDDNGHGTHVAGCAAGNGARSKGRYTGSAPKANLVGLKVLDKHGSGNLSDILAAIQFVIDNRKKFNIKVMNLSLGATGKHSYKNDPLCQAAEKAWAAGIVVCAAAGNSGPGSGTVSTPGIDPVIITVGAENTRRTIRINDDIIARFSGRGPTADRLTKPDVVAPGVNIISLRAPGSTADKQQAGSRVGKSYFVLSGTSMATPICSGIAALMIHKKPGITPDAVKRALKATARKIGSYSPNAQGNGLVDAQSAVTG